MRQLEDAAPTNDHEIQFIDREEAMKGIVYFDGQYISIK